MAIKKLFSFLIIFLLIFQNIAYWAVVSDKWLKIEQLKTVSENNILEQYRYIFQQINQWNADKLFSLKSDLELYSKNLDSVWDYEINSTWAINYNLSKAKAIYDSNIAIIDSKDNSKISYETPYYCDLLISSLAKFTKIWNNVCLSNYDAFSDAFEADPNRTYVTIINDDEIQNTDLSKFWMIIFPDIELWKYPVVLDNLTTTWIDKIKNYVEDWWITLFSSKSILLAEKMWILWDIVDEEVLVKHHTNQWKILLEDNNDFNTKILNYSLFNGKTYEQANTHSGSYYDYLLWSYFINDDPSLHKTKYFDIKNDSNYYFQEVSTSEDIDIDTEKVISSFYKKVGKWMLIYNWWNSIYSSWNNSHILYVNHILNAILLSFLREVYTETKVIQKSNPMLKENLIPALEKNIIFEYNFKWTNVFDKAVSNLKTEIKYQNGLKISNLPNECNLDETNKKITCTKNTLNSEEKWNIIFSIEIIEPNFSQKWKDIEVTNTTFSYINSDNKSINQKIWFQMVDALWSAEMRWNLNIDPSSYYPLKWEWVFIDQVLSAENKKETEWLDLTYSTIVPLISPLFDENDQEKLSLKLIFPKEYYNDLYNWDKKTWNYPFLQSNDSCKVDNLDMELNNRCKDFYIPNLFSNKYNKSFIKVDNYDEPVYKQKSDDTEAYNEINKDNFNIWDLGKDIEKQVFLPDASKLLMHAKPRSMPFIYPAKKEVLFAHQDIYFYDNPSFVLPKWITDRKSFISIDKYSDSYNLVCDWDKNTLNRAWSYKYPTWVIENEYSNYLKCNRWENKQITWNNLPTWINQTYYLYPIHSKNNIDNPTDLAGFDSEWNFVWYKNNSEDRNSGAYPIKFIKWSFANFYIPKNSSLKWWYFEFNLPSDVSENDIEKIYMLADHIAVTDIVRNEKNVKIYFYRWKMPNEQTIKSEFWIWIEWINKNMSWIEFKVYSLDYDLSEETNNQKYKFEQKFNIDFVKQNFFKLPAVKLKFEIPRRKRINTDDIKDLKIDDSKIAIIFDKVDWSDKVLVFKSMDRAAIEQKIDEAWLDDEIKSKLLNIFDNTAKESYVRKFENLEPFVRFWVYIQEILHRTIWWKAEDHPITDPWVVLDSTMFMSIFNVWTSPIPFREYLKTWETQIIPLWEESSRMDYKDLFNRQFGQPIRTTLPESVPLPPPLRNFMINTTYEMYDKDWNLKTSWDGEEELEIRQNVKVYNNFPKYFNPTICNDNKNRTDTRYWMCYDWSASWDYKFLDKKLNDTDFYYNSWATLFSKRSDYDDFMTDLNAKIEQDKQDWKIDTDYEVKFLKRATKDNVNVWTWDFIDDVARNYSPEVENYYPQNYIKPNMWNLTHYDYSDSPYEKWYPFHMDNHIPNVSESINQPHNILAIPFYKWLWYKTKYFQEEKNFWNIMKENDWKIEHNLTVYSSWKYDWKKWWWWENLQNRDDTTLAWNSSVNNVPYEFNTNTKEYLNTSNIDENDFEDIDKSTIKNIYTCSFNSKKLKDSDNKYVFKANVVENNVIPLIPWITKSDKASSNAQSYLDNYSCSSSSKEYDNSNMYKVNNVAETENSHWLYFWANLKWGSKEWLNLVSRLQKYPWRNYEWDVKAVEWWRFVYWNPANWPNSFLVVDNPVQVIKSVRSDLNLEKEVLPYTVKNYKTDVYLLYKLNDPTENFIDSAWEKTPRKWNHEIYTDSRWYWNYSSTIYVWNAYNKIWVKNSLLSSWEDTIVKLELFNNSGFDWEMLWTWTVVNDNWQYKTNISWAIDFEVVWNKALNWNDLISKITRNVISPNKYNFLSFDIPNELKSYVELVPSDTDIETPWTFFDFDNVNVTNIRDWYKWTYFVKLKLKDNIPDNLKWRVFDIKMSLNSDYFTHLPWVNWKDLVKWENKLWLPNIKFAIANTAWEAFYINWQSKNINISLDLVKWYDVDKIYKLDETWLNSMRNAAWNGTKKHQELREAFESFSWTYQTLNYNLNNWQDKDSININLSDNWVSQFPYFKINTWEVTKNSIENNLMFLVHLKREILEDWEHIVELNSKIDFVNSANKSKEKDSNLLKNWKSLAWESVKVFAQWPELTINYKSSIVWNHKNDELEIQKMVEWENTIKTKIFLKNIGSDVAFDPTIKINIESWVKINKEYTDIEGHSWSITYNWNQIIVKNLYTESWALNSEEWEAVWPWITNYIPIYLTYSWAYQDTPKKLIDSVEFEFTPFDIILPSKTWKDEEWFSLDFVKTSFEVQKSWIDKFSLYWSWNTLWVYWDYSINWDLKISKTTNPDDILLTKNFYLDPTLDHSFVVKAYFKTKNWGFALLKEFSKNISWEELKLENTWNRVLESKKYEIKLETNKLWKYNWQFNLELLQDWIKIFTWSLKNVPENWKVVETIDNVDVTKDSKIIANLYDNWNLIKTIDFEIAWEEAKIFDLNTERTEDWEDIKISFKTNKILDNCYKIYSNSLKKYLTSSCQNINKTEYNEFIDSVSDVFKEQEYKIEIFENSDKTNVLLNSIVQFIPDDIKTVWTPTKTFYELHYASDIDFSAVKDLKKDYLIDNTNIRYIVKLKMWNDSDRAGQKTSDFDAEIFYKAWYLYAWENWSKKIFQTKKLATSEIPDKTWYEKLIWIWLWWNTVIVTENQNIVDIKWVWKNPDIVELYYWNNLIRLNRCTSENKMCYSYTWSTLTIYTNKIGQIFVYNFKRIYHWWSSHKIYNKWITKTIKKVEKKDKIIIKKYNNKIWISLLKSHGKLIKQFIISKNLLNNKIKLLKLIDSKLETFSNEKLLKLYFKIEKILSEKWKYLIYKNILEYIQARVGLIIYKRNNYENNRTEKIWYLLKEIKSIKWKINNEKFLNKLDSKLEKFSKIKLNILKTKLEKILSSGKYHKKYTNFIKYIYLKVSLLYYQKNIY